MIRKYTNATIKSLKCEKCGKKISIGTVKNSDGKVLCTECNEEQSNAKTQQ